MGTPNGFLPRKTVSVVIGALMTFATFLAFVWYWQELQDNKTEDNLVKITRVEEYQEHATDLFTTIAENLKEQQALMAETQKALVAVKVGQENLVKVVDELKAEIKKNGGGRK